MDTAKLMYRILKMLEESKACTSDERMQLLDGLYRQFGEGEVKATLRILYNKGLIEGVTVRKYLDRKDETVLVINPQITADGIDHLVNNSAMAKASALIKGVIDVGSSTTNFFN